MGEYSTNLVGESNYQAAIRKCREGAIARLQHEPTNRFDKRAVMALSEHGETIGYLPRGHWLGRLIIDEKTDVFATVQSVRGGTADKPTAGVMLLVRTAGDAAIAREEHRR